jgi:hypothetical protein
MTTKALGERGKFDAIPLSLIKQGGINTATTKALGEQGGFDATTTKVLSK